MPHEQPGGRKCLGGRLFASKLLFCCDLQV